METYRLKNVVVFFQTILSFVLSRKICLIMQQKQIDLGSLKSEIDKLDIDKLKKVPVGLNSLKSKTEKLDVDKLVPVHVDLSKLSDAVKNYVKKMNMMNCLKMLTLQTTDGSNLVKATVWNSKINEIEKKCVDHYHSNKHITKQEFNKLMWENFVARLAQAN